MPDAADLTRLLRRLPQPEHLALLGGAGILAGQVGGVQGLAGFALALPPAFLTGRALSRSASPPTGADGQIPERADFVIAVDRALWAGRRQGRSPVVLVLEIDGWADLEERHDHPTLERLLRVAGTRLHAGLRDGDLMTRLAGSAFAVALAPGRRLDLTEALQVAGRLQRALGGPVALGEGDAPLSLSVGLALPERLDQPSGEALLRAATLAAIEARRSGPGAIRSYSEALRGRVDARGHLAEEVALALDRGEVEAHFQPQLSARTGAITGFEALARWQHPKRGLLPPSEFLPVIEKAGLMARLGERMLASGLSALREWDREGLSVPSVAVNFSNAELCDPRLVDRIAWELDRFDLTPDRLVIEVLETVVAGEGEDAVIHNLAGLARLGCCLDLDDFGTGQAPLSSIRRFSIERIKIDRSFVTRIDEDAEQQRMVGAILTMAERLGLDTLAEGVETEGERQMLTRMGCGHLQGYGIARPMPFADTVAWIRNLTGPGATPVARQLRAV